MLDEDEEDAEVYDHYPHHNPEYHDNEDQLNEDDYYSEQNPDHYDQEEYSMNESEMLREQIAAQEAGLAPRPVVDFDYDEDFCEMESIPQGMNSQYSDDVKYQPIEKKIIEPKGSRWTKPQIEGVAKTSGVKWGAPRYEEVEFPWNKPGSKRPKVKGQGFKKNDHIHGLPTWMGKRMVAPLPRPEKRKPSKPVRRSNVEHTTQRPVPMRNSGNKRRAKIVKVTKNSKGEIVKMIDENGKVFISPQYQKRLQVIFFIKHKIFKFLLGKENEQSESSYFKLYSSICQKHSKLYKK